MTTSSRLTDLVAVVRQDLTFGLRSLGRRKVFAVTAALTVAVGIAATTVALSIANGVLLASPPIPEPDRVVSIWEFRSRDVAESMEGRLLSYARYEGYRDATTDVFAPLAGHSYGHFSVGSSFGAFAVDGFLTSGNYFTMLGITPAAGRFYEDDDEPVVVISERLWRVDSARPLQACSRPAGPRGSPHERRFKTSEARRSQAGPRARRPPEPARP